MIIYRWAVYEWMLDGKQELEPVECSSCHYHAPLHTFDGHTEHSMRKGGPMASVKRHLCELCANSQCSNMTGYPSQYADVAQAVLTVYCANAVLEQLGKFKGAPVYTTTDNSDDMEIP